MDIKAFHRQRRMFFIDRYLFIAPARDWLMGVYKITQPQLRGYVDATGLYVYNIALRSRLGVKFLLYLNELRYTLDLSLATKMWNETIPGERPYWRLCLMALATHLRITDECSTRL